MIVVAVAAIAAVVVMAGVSWYEVRRTERELAAYKAWIKGKIEEDMEARSQRA